MLNKGHLFSLSICTSDVGPSKDSPKDLGFLSDPEEALIVFLRNLELVAVDDALLLELLLELRVLLQVLHVNVIGHLVNFITESNTAKYDGK